MKRALLMLLSAAALVVMQLPECGAATLWNVGRVIKENLTAPTGAPVRLPDGSTLSNIKIEYLRALYEAHDRIGAVSKVNSELALLIEPAPNARAHFGQRMIVVTTGMLQIIGADPNMIAAVLGHEFAHLSLRHAVQKVLNVDALVYGGLAVASGVSGRTKDNDAALRAGVAAVGLMAASFSRRQEKEADQVGVELMSRAKYDPQGVLKLLEVFVKLAGNRQTGYLDSHPGFEDRLKSAGTTVRNQQYDGVAMTLHEGRQWRSLAALTDQWLKTNADSSGAWYYRGLALRGLRQRGAVTAFERAVSFDANSMQARLELCVELYRLGREQESLLCSEFLPPGDPHEDYVARTFRHPVFVAGFARGPSVREQTVQMMQDVASLRQKPAADSATTTATTATTTPPQSPPPQNPARAN